MKKTTITLSFDDGRSDNYRLAKEILIPQNIPATINVTTGYIDGSLKSLGGFTPTPMSINQIKELHKSGLIEIACHGHMHKNDESDIVKGREKLLNMLNMPEDTKIGFASPGSGMTPDFIRNNIARLSKFGFEYIRTGFENMSFKHIRNLSRKISRVIHSGLLYSVAYKDTVVHSIEKMLIKSVPILHDTSFSEIISLVRLAERKDVSLILMFHSILGKNETGYNNGWCWDYNNFVKLISFLKDEESSGRLIVCDTMSAYHNKMGR